jgi:hypothetical protein
MAEKRTIDINIKNNADEATKDFNTFNDALDETAKSAKNVNSTFEEVYGDLQPLTTRLGEAEDRLYELALAGDTTSKEYQELLTKVGEYRKVQIETDLAVDGAATTMTQKLGSALNGVTSGFATTQGALALFGTENEKLEKSLLKVQGALAIQQGVDGLRTSYKELGGATGIATKAQAALNFVMSLNPFVLIATAIAAAIAALATFTSVLDPVIDKVKQFGDFLGLTNFEEEEREEARKKRAEAQRKRTEAEIERETKLNDLRKRNFQDQQKAFDRRIALLQAEGKENGILEQLKELNAIKEAKRNIAYAQGQIERIRLLKRRLDGQSQEAKQFEQQIDAFNQAIKDSNQQILDSNNQLKINVINANKEKADSYKQYRDTRLQIARQIEDLENELLEEGLEKELEINRDRFRRLREDAEGNAEEQARLRELYTEQEAKAEAEIRNKFRKESLQEEIDFFTENKLPVLQAQADEEVEVEINKWSLIGQAQAEAYKKEEALRKRNQDFAVQTTLDGLSLISDITELFGKKGEKQAKKAFQVQKAAQIAGATIETFRAAQSAYLSQFLPVPDPSSPVRGGIAAGVAVAAGLVNVAKIASQKFEGGGATGGGSDFSGGGVGGGEVAPQFNVVGDSGINQLAQLQQQPTQAFVVSGEVTSAQALDRNRVTNATL